MKNTDIYLKIVGDNYRQFKKEFFNYCQSKKMPFRQDDFHQAILDVEISIEKGNFKKELNNKNIKNYVFIAFRNQCSKHLKSKELKHISIDTPINDEGLTLLDKLENEIDDFDVELLEKQENDEIREVFNILNIIEKEFGLERKQIYLRVLRGDKLKDINNEFPNARGKYLTTLYWLQQNYNINNHETTN